MSAADIEQYRPGFEAWIKTRPGYPFAGAFTNLMWEAYIAAKREASTESAKPLADEARLKNHEESIRLLTAGLGALAKAIGPIAIQRVNDAFEREQAAIAHTKAQEK